MQVRVPSFFSIAMASSRDAFPIHNTHLPGACNSSRRQPGACVLPHALADLSFAFGSHQAPAQSQAAYSYGQQQMAPNPYAMWPQVRLTSAFNPAHPAHTLATPPSLVREEKKRSSPDA